MKFILICFSSFVFLLFVSESYEEVTVKVDRDRLSFNPSHQLSQSEFRPLNYEESSNADANRRQLSNPFEYHTQLTNHQPPEGSRLSNPFEYQQRPEKGWESFENQKKKRL